MPRPDLADSFNPNANVSVYSIAVQADGKILVGGSFTNIGGQPRNRIARLDATTGLAIRSTRTRTMLSFQSRCRRTARFWRAAISRASADRRATASPGSMPPPAWLIRSTRTRTTVSFAIAVQADGKILVGGAFTEHRRTDAQPHRPARCHDRTGRFVQPERERCCLFNRGAGGRQDFGRRRFHAASADRRAIASPGSMPRPAWLIRSTRTRTVLSFQSRCRRTARF